MSESPTPPAFFSEFSHALDQLFPDVPFGLALFDRSACYLQVNEGMAAINGRPVTDHPGRAMAEVNPGVAAVLEPIVRSALSTGAALVDMEVPAPVDGQAEPRFWRISCFLLRALAGTVRGAGVVVRDTTEQKLRDATQEERLKFESLLSNLSTAFINVPIAEVGRKIELGLKSVVDFLGFDRASIWQFLPEDGRLHLVYSYALPGIKMPPPMVDREVPVWTALCRRGEMFKVSDVEELSDELWREKRYCRELGGIKSFLFIPMSVGGTVVGLASFASYRVKLSWPELLVQRLRILGDVFGNALERKRADQKIQKALAEIRALTDRLEAENHYLRDQVRIEQKFEEIIGQSPAIRKVLQQVEQVAQTDSTVLLQGETGTGKELIARAIHRSSGRKDRPMIKLNCAALPATLIEAELFGHEKGAYTGATAMQIGRFEAASGATIFLDEIGELPLDLQAKLLRVLQEGQFERLGSTKPIDVDVRVIAATNRNLAQEVKAGRFREDLFYRLNVFPISIPPLRERSEDIPMLVRSMVQEFGVAFGKTIESIPRKNMDALRHYPWPGNIRELRNAVERGMILSNGSTLVVDLPDQVAALPPTSMSHEDMERTHIRAVLESTGWRVRGRQGAAELLHLKPSTLESKMKKLGIRRPA